MSYVISKLHFKHTFIICKNSQKELIIDLDMQQLHWIGYDWINNGQLFLHQGTNITH